MSVRADRVLLNLKYFNEYKKLNVSLIILMVSDKRFSFKVLMAFYPKPCLAFCPVCFISISFEYILSESALMAWWLALALAIWLSIVRDPTVT